ncbi:hypothetical protein C8R44DRAFT_871513 [Mycena epipterygia]|nr:hypothetical protein C8R44DRAFT_871513 [Mycena epipterygia]
MEAVITAVAILTELGPAERACRRERNITVRRITDTGSDQHSRVNASTRHGPALRWPTPNPNAKANPNPRIHNGGRIPRPEIAECQSSIREIEQSMAQIAEIFRDLAVLVDSQGADIGASPLSYYLTGYISVELYT